MGERSVKRKEQLVQMIERFAKQDGTHETLIPALRFTRSSRASEPVYSVYEPSLCVVAQGSKLVMLGQESYRYDPNSYLVASVHLPITGQVMEAAPETPYLSLQLQFDMDQILEVIQASVTVERAKPQSGRGLYINRMSDTLHDALLRLVQLLDTPDDIPVLAPYAIREIVYRVLQDEQGTVLKQFALLGSHAQRITMVIKRINRDFAMPLHIDELTAEAGMSLVFVLLLQGSNRNEPDPVSEAAKAPGGAPFALFNSNRSG